MRIKDISGCICGKDKSLVINRNRVLIGTAFTFFLFGLIFVNGFDTFYTACLVLLILMMIGMAVYYSKVQQKHGHTASW